MLRAVRAHGRRVFKAFLLHFPALPGRIHTDVTANQVHIRLTTKRYRIQVHMFHPRHSPEDSHERNKLDQRVLGRKTAYLDRRQWYRIPRITLDFRLRQMHITSHTPTGILCQGLCHCRVIGKATRSINNHRLPLLWLHRLRQSSQYTVSHPRTRDILTSNPCPRSTRPIILAPHRTHQWPLRRHLFLA
jgi:hypothetical protein